MRPVFDILQDIENFSPVDGVWLPLDGLLEELWTSGVHQEHIAALFRVFERFPDQDGAGVLWSIVHGVEALPFEYETGLRESMARTPSFMGGVMLKRLGKSCAG
jgi:hypothetical protein